MHPRGLADLVGLTMYRIPHLLSLARAGLGRAHSLTFPVQDGKSTEKGIVGQLSPRGEGVEVVVAARAVPLDLRRFQGNWHLLVSFPFYSMCFLQPFEVRIQGGR